MSAISDGTTNVQSAYKSGQDSINAFDPNAYSKGITSGQNSLYGVGGAQNQQSDQYIQAYKDAVNANPSVSSLYSKANSDFNVPGLAQNAATLNNAVLQAPQQTLDSARGFNYDNNQVANQTNLTLGRLSPLAAAATNQSQTAQTLAGQAVQAGVTQNQMNLLPVQQQGTQLAQLWAQQATGFDQNAKNTLDGLVAKVQAGERLSESEMAQYASLATAEENYNSAVKVAQTNNQYQPVAQNSNLVDTFTGSVLNPTITNKTGTQKFS